MKTEDIKSSLAVLSNDIYELQNPLEKCKELVFFLTEYYDAKADFVELKNNADRLYKEHKALVNFICILEDYLVDSSKQVDNFSANIDSALNLVNIRTQ